MLTRDAGGVKPPASPCGARSRLAVQALNNETWGTYPCVSDNRRLAPEPLPGERVIAVPVGTRLEDVEKLVSSETLRHPGGNKAQAASLLGISARTIYRKQAPDDGEIE
jgi:DNA-binding NtrC family response regulator